ncbi:hypothetical protein [Nocardioides sp.]|uniref:hypothetical protein n=1 Tax=Nocardioides sp. TaxID=35761 RepID=UPI003563A4C6
MNGERKFRVRWWMWGVVALAHLGIAVWGALADDAPRAIYGAVFATLYGFLAGVLLMREESK